jgi:hypothetical protein
MNRNLFLTGQVAEKFKINVLADLGSDESLTLNGESSGR